MAGLSEFDLIVDDEWGEAPPGVKAPTQEELTGALQVMITRQIVYASTPGLGGTYELVRNFAPFFSRYFGALGYRFVYSPRDQMVALSVPQGETRYDAVYERLRNDETLVLLGLRLIWEEAVANQDITDGGVCETTTGDLIDRIKNVTQKEPPPEGRLMDILRLFQRHGAVRVGQRDRVEKVTPMSIYPGIPVLVPDTYVDELKLKVTAPTTASETAANQNDEL